MKRRLCILAALLLLLGTGALAMENDVLDDLEVTRVLQELSDKENADYLVVPDHYTPPTPNNTNRYTLLLMGVDTDLKGVQGRSDTMMVAQLDLDKRQLKLVSFMRDLYVKIPGKGHNRLNAAYAFGGPELAKKTLKNNFGIEADGYLAVNFSGMITLVDAIGGIDMEVEQPELKKLNGILEYYNYQNGRPQHEGRLENYGLQHLTGLQAMSYARIRKLDSDYERIGRQQRVMMAIFHRLRQLPVQRLSDIMLENIDLVATDVNMNDAFKLMGSVVQMDMVQMRYLRIPVKGASKPQIIKEAYIIIPNLKKNVAAIETFLGGE